MATYNLKNTTSQPVTVYFYLGGEEKSIMVDPGEVGTFTADKLSPSTDFLLKERILKSDVTINTPQASSESINVMGLGYTGRWTPDFKYERGFVSEWNGVLWIATRNHKGNTAPSLSNSAWDHFGIKNIDSLVDANIETIAENSVLIVQTTIDGKKWVASPLSGGAFVDGAIPISKVQDLSNQLAGKLSTSGGTLTGQVSLAIAPTAGSHLVNKGYADTKIASSGGTLTGALDYTESVVLNGPQTLVPKSYVDAVFQNQLAISGGVMTGFLTLVSGTPTADYHAVPKIYADTKVSKNGNETITGPLFYADSVTLSGSRELAHKGYVDTKLAVSGGTLTGFLTLHQHPSSDLHAATKKYVDESALRGGVLTGLLSLPSSIPLSDPTNLVPKSYVDSEVAKAVRKSGDTMTGALTLHALPSAPLHAATKSYVDNLAGISGDVLLKSGGAMTGPITGDHGLLQSDGSKLMTGPLGLATLSDSPASSGIVSISNAGSGKVWLSLSSVAGWTLTQYANISGTASYNGVFVVEEIDVSLSRIRVSGTFTTSQTGTASAIQRGVYRSPEGSLTFEGKKFVSQGSQTLVSADYSVVEGDGLILVDTSSGMIRVSCGGANQFSSYPITIRKVTNDRSPALINLAGSPGRISSLTLDHLGDSVTIQAFEGSWVIMSGTQETRKNGVVEFGTPLLNSSGKTDVRATIYESVEKILQVTLAATASGGSSTDFTVNSVEGLLVGGTFTIEGSLVGYNGTYTITDITGSVVRAAVPFIATDTCSMVANVLVGSKENIIVSASVSSSPETIQLTSSISGVSDGGTGFIWVVLSNISGWTVQHFATITGTSSYDGTFNIDEVDSANSRIRVRGSYVATSTGTALGGLGAEVIESVGIFGKVLSVGSNGAVVRPQSNGSFRAQMSLTAEQTAEMTYKYAHVLSGGQLNVIGSRVSTVVGADWLNTSISSFSDGGSGTTWVNVSSSLGWAVGDTLLITLSTAYNGQYSILEVDNANNRVKIQKVFSVSQTGTATSRSAAQISVPNGTTITPGTGYVVRGVTKLGADIVDVVADIIVSTSAEVIFTARRVSVANIGSTVGVLDNTSSYRTLLLNPWLWLRNDFVQTSSLIDFWNDISENGRHFSSSASDRPTYSPLGISNYPAATFTASKVLSLVDVKSVPLVAIIVAKADNATPAATEILFDMGSGTSRVKLQRNTNGSYTLTVGSTNVTSATSITDTNRNVYLVRVSAGQSTVNKNGLQIINGTPSTPGSLNGIHIGDGLKTNSFVGKISEFMLFDTNTSLAALVPVEVALAGRY